jgi:hypothetical protein
VYWELSLEAAESVRLRFPVDWAVVLLRLSLVLEDDDVRSSVLELALVGDDRAGEVEVPDDVLEPDGRCELRSGQDASRSTPLQVLVMSVPVLA